MNFRVDLAKAPEPAEWYVRLKSDSLPGEERTVNEALYRKRVSLGQLNRRMRDQSGRSALTHLLLGLVRPDVR